MSTAFYVRLGLAVMLSCFSLGLISIIIYKTSCAEKKESVRRNILAVAMVHFITNTAAASLKIMTRPNENDSLDINNYVDVMRLVYIILFLFSYLASYAFFMMQLHYALHGSVFSPSKCVYATYGIFNCLIIIFFGIGIVFWRVKLFFWYSWLIVWFFGVLCLVCEFNYKLFGLVLSQRKSVYVANDNNAELNDRQSSILGVTAKLSVITTAFKFIIVIYFVQEICFLQFTDYRNSYESIYSLISEAIQIALNIAIETLLFLAFGMNRKHYKNCCGRCDKTLTQTHTSFALKRIKSIQNKTEVMHELGNTTP